MRKNFLQVASAVALLLTVAFAGCSRDEGNANGETRSVFVKVTPTEMRSITTPVPSGAKTALNNGWIFFTNGAGVISRFLEVNSAANNYTAGTYDDEVTPSQLETGIQIEDVPGTATRVYVFGNAPSTWSPTLGENISTYVAGEITVHSQYNIGSVALVTLYGDGNILPKSGGDPDEFEANVEVSPVSGRVEVDKITANAAEINSFNVAWVFVNYYYPTRGIDGTGTSTIANNGSAVANYAAGAGSYTGNLATVGLLHDTGPFNSTGPVYEHGADAVWAYNLLAPKLGSGQHYFPHIVIKINNIEVADPAYEDYEDEDWYLTITNVYKTSVTNPTSADYLDFEKGKVYTLNEVSFSLGELSTTPEPDEKKVSVKVTVKEWELVPVNPVL